MTARHSASPTSILILDDEEIVLVALRDTLVREGYVVKACTSPAQALEALRTEQFAVVVSDQQMPALTGLDFLAQVKQIQPGASRVLISAVVSFDTVIDSINKCQVCRFILKPWVREDLISAIRAATEQHHLIRLKAVFNDRSVAANQQFSRLNSAFARQIAKQLLAR
jgi:DNA-binding NtrC family response regulator